MVDFILGFHCHQPIGNFGQVFSEVHKKSYSPLLRTLFGLKVKFSLHASGILLEWWEKNDPEFMEIIAAGVAENNIELMGGGYYEPVLASIPEKDRSHQIELLSSALFKHFGKYPVGAWITERIWQPDIIKSLAANGIKYAFLDDSQFFQAGISPEDIDNVFRTEYEGDFIDLFPIHERLRYKLPFAEPEESLEAVLSLGERKSRLSVMFDDGEKMGAWPDTYEWVYGKEGKCGWLENFINTSNGSVNFDIPSSIFESKKERLPVYIPISSYREMGEWTLGINSRKRYEEAKKYVPPVILSGGIWHNFLTKYPESNLLHKRMVNLSLKINRAAKIQKSKMSGAIRELLKSQANDAYWHGVFGGIYLPHLRRAVRKAFINAYIMYKSEDKCLTEVEKFDFDMDGKEEIHISNDCWMMVYKPSDGTLLALDYLGKGLVNSMGDLFCLHNEYDIVKLADKEGLFNLNGGGEKSGETCEGDGSNKPPRTIHKDVKYPEGVSSKDLVMRKGMLPSFEVRFNGEPLAFRGESVKTGSGFNRVILKSTGFSAFGSAENRIIELSVKVEEDVRFEIEYGGNLSGPGSLEAVLRFSFPGGNGPATSISVGDYVSGLDKAYTNKFNKRQKESVRLRDTFWGGETVIESLVNTADTQFEVRPVRTVSLSENGYEWIFQGIELIYKFDPADKYDGERIGMASFALSVEKL